MTEAEINQAAHELLGVMAATGEIDATRGLKICEEIRRFSKGEITDGLDPLSEAMFKASVKWGIPPDDLVSVIGRITVRILTDSFKGETTQ